MMKKLLFILILCSNVAFGQETTIEALNDSTIIWGNDTLRISNYSLHSDSVHIAPPDTFPAYFMYSNTKTYKIDTPPHFSNLQFKAGGTRKEYDNNIYWCNGFIVQDNYNWETRLLNENKKPFPDDIMIWYYRLK